MAKRRREDEAAICVLNEGPCSVRFRRSLGAIDRVDQKPVDSLAIITTDANELAVKVHTIY